MKSPERRLEDIERRLPSTPKRPVPLPVVPNIIDFVVSCLNRPQLYPRQATLLKLWFLQDDLLTDYDRKVIGEWESESEQDGSGLIRGYGLPAGILDRVAQCRAESRRWFSELVAVVGRRGSKGYLGAIAVAYVIATYLAKGHPQQHYGIAKDKTLVLPVFAGTKDQSQDNFWQDLRNVLIAAPFFAPYIAESRTDRILLWSHDQLSRERRPDEKPAFEVVARESTENAGRGYTAFGQVFDEMAHAVSGGSNRSADQLYVASQPALNQFGKDAFSYLASSPRNKAGQFYQSFANALARDRSGAPCYPQVLCFQFPSWELYRDWEQAHLLEMYPGGPCFAPISRPVMAESDPEMQRFRLTKPEKWRVEFLAQWAEVDSPFLQRAFVDAMFEPWDGRQLEMQSRRSLSYVYVFHLDLSVTGDNTVLVIGHREPSDDPGRPQFVIDLVRVWRPSDFPDGHVDFRMVEAEVKHYMDCFHPKRVTVDPWNGRSIIENLRDYAYKRHLRVEIEAVPTSQLRNREIAETFRTALYERRVHCPPHQLARDELLYLRDTGTRVDHPDTGPCTTNDIATCLFEVTMMLTDLAFDPGRQLSALGLRSRSWPEYRTQEDVFDALSGFSRLRRSPRRRY